VAAHACVEQQEQQQQQHETDQRALTALFRHCCSVEPPYTQ
jgi:hypothetical protein